MRYKDIVAKPLNESDAGTTSACNVATVVGGFFGGLVEPEKKKKKSKKQKPVVITRPHLYK